MADEISFEEGLERIKAAISAAGWERSSGIITSRHPGAKAAQQLLQVDGIPSGFTKWQLPVNLDSASQLFLTVAQPGAETMEHSHSGDGFRFIAGGSIIHAGTELTAGDWMYIPGGHPYSFSAGELGAIMCSCYCCCCVPAAKK